MYRSGNFQKCSVCTLWFWGRDCIHSWHVNDKYCIAITPAEQSLYPVDCAW